MKKLFLILSMVAMLAFTAGTASALSLDAGGNATDGSSSVNFTIVGTDLIITLTSNDTNVQNPGDVLTALFFSIVGDPALSSDSAVLGAGSSVINDTQPAGGVVGGEWAYSNDVADAANAYGVPVNEGISSTGLGVFGDPTFPGANLAGPDAVDGGQYGIIGGLASNANPAVSSEELIQNTVVFTLDGFTGSLSDIGNIVFQYGTSLPTRVSEPGTLLLLGSGLLGIGLYRRRRK